ncbi:S-layer homology domain-containing protein [Paenibacillus sp. HB172176]|uniref:S-layer homology domain-containing protein n=1 Tax=Paenibacillus sp. HB172176 TaxID=2493690 RepID=UPI00143B4742|nr:S-layer homology domain-containing protein [Paenibacillus sp. HB172176]
MLNKMSFKKTVTLLALMAILISSLLQGNSSIVMAAEEVSSADIAAGIDPSIHIQMYNMNLTDETDEIKASFKLTNTGTESANLQDIKVRYYFTSDGSNVLSYESDSSSSTIEHSFLGNFVKLPETSPNADYYFEMGFDEFAGTLAAGEHIAFHVSIHKNIEGNFKQSNDYSFNETASDYADWNKATAYYGGSLIWGDEISVLAPPSENYALNKTVTASSILSTSEAGGIEGWALNNVVDGERRSVDGSFIGWSSGEGDNQWIKIDIGSSQLINRVDLYAINWLSDTRGRNGIVGEGFPVDFTIQVSEDNASWTTVSAQTNVLRPTESRNSYWFDAIQARYVKVETTKNRKMSTVSGIRAALSEIEVYNDGSYEAPSSAPTVPSTGRAMITPEEFTGAIQNPLMGMAEKDFSVNLSTGWPLDYNPWSSLAMTYIPWDLLEDDVDDTIEKIEQYSNERWRGQDTNGNWVSYEDYNMKVIPRVYLKFPSDVFHGLEGDHWPADMNANDLTSSEFDKRLKRLLQRLGALWDNDPRVAYIQMGIYGTWGEQHGTGVPEYVDAYFHQYFPNKKVEVRYEGHDEYSFGQYNDSIANMKVISNWKKQEIGGETAYDYNGADLLGTNPHLTMLENSNNAANMIRNVHATYLTWIGEYTYRIDPGYPGLPAYYENKEVLEAGAEKIQKAFGYRYVITDFNYPTQVDPGQDFVVQFKVKNTGAAPMYYNWPVQLSLKDPQTGEIVWSDTFNNLDIRDWLPGEGYESWDKSNKGNWSQSVLDYFSPPQEYTVANTFHLPSSITANKDYMIQLAVLDPAGNVPSLRFAIQNYKYGGYSPMGYMGVSQEPESITIDPSYFDSPAKDISLRYYTANSPSQSESSRLSTVTVSGSNPVIYVEGGDDFNLDQLTITGEDQFGHAHNVMTGIPVTWSITSGDSHATLLGNKLVPVSPGQGTITATLDGVTSNEFEFHVEQTSNTGAIAGTIQDNFGRLLQGVQVSVTVDGNDYTGITDVTGVYNIANVPIGTGYTVTATGDGYQEAMALGIEVTGATTTSVNLTMLVAPAGHFNDDFSGGSGNWTPGTGTWTVSDGEYIQSAGSNKNSWQYSTAITGKVWYDATYEVDLKVGPSNTSWASFMFRKQKQSDSANNSGYFVELTSTGKVELIKAGKSVTSLAKVENVISDVTQFHHLKIVTEGSNIKVFIDNDTAPVIDVNDTTYLYGYAGLGNGGAEWHYDNVTVTTSISTSTVAGNVSDISGKPIQGANVILSNGESDYSVVTDAAGNYSISDVPVGTEYTLTVSKSGYEEEIASAINVNEDNGTIVNFSMRSNLSGIFNDDFSDGDGKWSPGDGNWTVADGKYVQTQIGGNNSWRYMSAISGKMWDDATYEVDIEYGEGENWGAFLFRKSNQDDHINNSGYFVDWQYSGEIELCKAGHTINCIATAQRNTDWSQMHHLKIVNIGSNIKVYVDHENAPIIDVDDDTFKVGYASLGANGSKWIFDNVKITTDFEAEDTTPPGEVTEQQVETGDGQLVLSWTDPTDSDLSSIKISGYGETVTDAVYVNKGVETYAVAGLENGTVYKFVIAAIDTNDNESVGIVVEGTPRTPSNNDDDDDDETDQSSSPDPSDNNTTDNPEETIDDTETDIMNGLVAVNPTVNNDGKATVKLDAEIVKRALKQTTGDKLQITVEADEGMNEVEVSIPVHELLSNGTASVNMIEVDTGLATLSVSTELISKGSETVNQVVISVAKADISSLSAETQTKLKDVAVYDFNLSVDGEKISEFDGRSDVQVAIPYELQPAENPNQVVIYYLNNNGVLEVVKNGRYNEATDKVEFKPAHFSKYAAVYNHISFNDVTTAWSKAPIEALAARGIVSGDGDGTFRPESQVTRSEFLTMLLNLFELTAPQTAASATFSDVQSDAWYADEVAAALELGIVNGRTDGTFDPEDSIMRQDMAVMAYHAAAVAGHIMKDSSNGAPFADGDQIDEYAREAVAAMKASEVIHGMDNGEFIPNGIVTRSQAAVVIYNLLVSM